MLLACLVVPLGLLTSCGEGTAAPGAGEGFADRLDAVTIGGEDGTDPTIEWTDQMRAGEPEQEILVEGDGEPLAEGDQVYVNYLVADGYTQETPIDTYGAEAPAAAYTVGEPVAEAQSLDDVMLTFLNAYLGPGVTRGTRIAITADAEAVFGSAVFAPAVTDENIGNQDGLLIIADVVDATPLDGPEGTVVERPAWAPRVVNEGGSPVRLDFANVPAPNDQLRMAYLIEGDGPVVEDGDLTTVNYLGQLPDADTPFDESYSTQPLPTPIGLGAVISGWDKRVVGVPVGSRIILQVPPGEGYGRQGSGEDIPGGSTLYFVIDVLGTA